MSNAKDEFALLAHVVDKLHGNGSTVVRLTEHLGRSIKSPTKPVAL